MSRQHRDHLEAESQSAPFPDAAFALACRAAMLTAAQDEALFRADMGATVQPDWPSAGEIAEYEEALKLKRVG